MTRPDGSLGWKNVLLAGIDSPASDTSTICCTGIPRRSTASRHAPFATGSSASEKSRVVYVEDPYGNGEYKLTIFFTPASS